jgi:ABC-2 type transport system ATP-binding protein
MLATLLPPTAGSASVAGADLRREPQRVRERIGYVPQGGSTDPAETGRGELVIQGRLYGMDRARAVARAAEVLAALDLEAAADRRIATYSGGMKRRLDIGLGIVHRPSVLFLDEPTTGLDPQARARMWDEIRRLREDGTTVFLTTHYLEEADALADRLAIIDHGRIVAEGTADELKRQVAGDVITLGVDGAVEHVLEAVRAQPFVREASREDAVVRLYVDQGDVAVPQLIRVLDAAGLHPRSLTLARPSLDDVFLRQTGRSLREEPAA